MPIKGKVDLNQARQILNKDLRSVYLGGLKPMVAATPADSGVTRNSWFLTDGMPLSLSTPRGADTSGSKSESSILTNMPNYVLGKKLYFTNNSPAAIPLEYGGYPDPVKKGSYDKNQPGKDKYVKLSQGGWSKQLKGAKGWVRIGLIAMARKLANL